MPEDLRKRHKPKLAYGNKRSVTPLKENRTDFITCEFMHEAHPLSISAWGPDRDSGGREWNSFTILPKKHRLALLRHARMHDVGIPIPLHLGGQTLKWIAPRNIKNLVALALPTLEAMGNLEKLESAPVRCEVNEAKPQAREPRNINWEVNEVITHAADRIQQLHQHVPSEKTWQVPQHYCCSPVSLRFRAPLHVMRFAPIGSPRSGWTSG